MLKRQSIALCCVFLFCMTQSLRPQETRVSISGLVVDAQQQPVPGAEVLCRNTATGVSVSATANEQGNYRICLPG